MMIKRTGRRTFEDHEVAETAGKRREDRHAGFSAPPASTPITLGRALTVYCLTFDVYWLSAKPADTHTRTHINIGVSVSCFALMLLLCLLCSCFCCSFLVLAGSRLVASTSHTPRAIRHAIPQISDILAYYIHAYTHTLIHSFPHICFILGTRY